jgi:hypothetical protein
MAQVLVRYPRACSAAGLTLTGSPRLRYDLRTASLINPQVVTAWRQHLAQAASVGGWGYPPGAGLRSCVRRRRVPRAARHGAADDVVVRRRSRRSRCRRVLVVKDGRRDRRPRHELASRAAACRIAAARRVDAEVRSGRCLR